MYISYILYFLQKGFNLFFFLKKKKINKYNNLLLGGDLAKKFFTVTFLFGSVKNLDVLEVKKDINLIIIFLFFFLKSHYFSKVKFLQSLVLLVLLYEGFFFKESRGFDENRDLDFLNFTGLDSIRFFNDLNYFYFDYFYLGSYLIPLYSNNKIKYILYFILYEYFCFLNRGVNN